MNGRRARSLQSQADSGNGFAFPPVTGMPEKTTGELLADAILTAVETTGAIPKEIRVRSAEHKALAEGLAKALGSKVTVVNRYRRWMR